MKWTIRLPLGLFEYGMGEQWNRQNPHYLANNEDF